MNHKWQSVVVKLGTSTLTQGTKSLSRRVMLEMARQMALVHDQGARVVLVTSGAVAAGREALQHPRLDSNVPTKQMLSSIGQGRLMHLWGELFGLFDIQVGQVLLARGDFSNRQRYLNVRDTLSALLQHRVIPIINENDTVATKEIKVGDNDNLAALVANLIAADALILLTDQEGLYTADPRIDKDAKLIPVVEHIDEAIFALAGGTHPSGGLGTGGMTTKVQAAHLASQSGTQTIVASSSYPEVILRLYEGKRVGTLFQAEISSRESRKRWLLSEKKQGAIHMDAGAEQQVRKKGASLLAVGVVQTTGDFDRGAIVELMGPSGKPIAVGLANYSSQEIKAISGKHSNKISELLGYSYGPEVIHRDNLTLLKFKGDAEE